MTGRKSYFLLLFFINEINNMNRFLEEYEQKVAPVLEEGLYCENSPLYLLRGQVWQDVVLPVLIDELRYYWKTLAMQGRTLFEAARYARAKTFLY